MFSWESRRTRRSGRVARRPDIAAMVESLESRELLATSVLGQSLPDLTITGTAPVVASWGQPIAVTVDVRNIGVVGGTIEPLALAPGSPSSADAPASTVGVFATRNPRSMRGSVFVGSVDVPAVSANNVVQVTQEFTLPTQPPGLPGDGGRIYFVFKANVNNTFLESDITNNQSPPVAVQIQAPLPELAAVGFDVPPRMQPGDTIQPNIRVANLGPGDTAPQGPVQVAIVTASNRSLTANRQIVALYTIDDIPPQSLVPTKGPVLADANLEPSVNVVTIAGEPFALPPTPANFYIGVVVDPFNQIHQLKNVGLAGARSSATLARRVGLPIPGLPPAGVDVPGGVANVPLFPIPFGGIPVGSNPSTTTTTASVVAASAGTAVTTDSLSASAASTPVVPSTGSVSSMSPAARRAAVLARFRNAATYPGLARR